MFKLNQKGTTLMELIISIALISVVLVFMFQLLLDVNNEQENNNFAINNQVNRAEVIRYISNDLANYTLTSISDLSTSKDALIFSFNYKENLKTTIEAREKTITVTNSKNEKRTWEVKDATIYPNKANIYTIFNNDAKIYSLQIYLEIHTVNDENTEGSNNGIDDINLSYIGNMTDFTPVLNCLGYCCHNTC